MCRIKLLCQDKTISYESNESCLLDTLKKNEIFIEFQCTEGFCGACRTKKVSGEVAYHTEPLAYLNDKEILPCCCRPLTDLELEI
ncbi:class I ribonucleotide reductase maintenance protein YfaE [Thorsellia kenyensis]|uniref:Class I ribonucleotide reductase maintenance protein YfaE n=1 Tax=Thorsellia kenyensis TaxID=1549888 RepID=A0ABV6CAY2_9GAMM